MKITYENGLKVYSPDNGAKHTKEEVTELIEIIEKIVDADLGIDRELNKRTQESEELTANDEGFEATVYAMPYFERYLLAKDHIRWDGKNAEEIWHSIYRKAIWWKVFLFTIGIALIVKVLFI